MDWEGPLCRCSVHCEGECSYQGHCSGNCSEGWFGSSCHQKCSSHCKRCEESPYNCTECYHGYPPLCSSEKLYISEETMTMMMAGGGIILVLVLITICIIIIIRKLCQSSNQGDTYGFIETQDIELEPMSQTNPYADLESAQYINDSNRMTVDEFILNVHHKKLNHAFRREFKKIPYRMNESYYAAIDPKNKSRNRYKKVYPYDSSRVVLDTSDFPGSSDYINACFVHGFHKQRAYIASQGPFTEETVLDFWRMVWQMRSVKIVMLTNLTEEGNMKCLKYWPNTEALIGPFLIKTERQNTCRRYIIRHIKLKLGIEERVVKQYQYTAWYTTRVPNNVDSLLLFRNLVMSDVSDDDGPIIVHCSAGVGRTGTFIALDYLLDEGISTGYLDVVGYIQILRQQRAYAVQSTDEYIFLHDALVEGFTSKHENRSIEIADEL
ncbi:receptor-type tyrosine-protein phosphatase T-like [Saccostrea cucullata]|uniref:receptor-type tyrosine-protein phosphatase T-like n=1 Tax=Saccostrea cuccullata TaxID=36930 RepID=UPI002ED3234D